MIGFLIINSTSALVIIGGVLVLISIMGWGLQDPMATHGEKVEPGKYAATFAEAAKTGKPTPLAEIALPQAEDVVDKIVTVSTTAWSAHPVKVFIQREGLVLSLYAQAELQEQQKQVEETLRLLPV